MEELLITGEEFLIPGLYRFTVEDTHGKIVCKKYPCYRREGVALKIVEDSILVEDMFFYIEATLYTRRTDDNGVFEELEAACREYVRDKK